MHAATKQLPQLEKAVEKYREEGTEFAAETREAATPSCDTVTTRPLRGTTWCFKFTDGKP